MNATQEMVSTLFTPAIIEQVKKQFRDKTEKVPIDSFGMSFRLFLSKYGNINLELLIQMPAEEGAYQNIEGFGRGIIQKNVMFFKPIGFFSLKKGFFTNTLEITILKEFEKDFNILLKDGKIPSSIKVNTLTLQENAVLAAFSMEAYLKAEKYEDSSFSANGLYCDMFMTFEGYPQVFLDDRHGIDGPIAAYLLREKNTINPIMEYQNTFNMFSDMSLLTALKRI
jgi:hypothetical protein